MHIDVYSFVIQSHCEQLKYRRTNAFPVLQDERMNTLQTTVKH